MSFEDNWGLLSLQNGLLIGVDFPVPLDFDENDIAMASNDSQYLLTTNGVTDRDFNHVSYAGYVILNDLRDGIITRKAFWELARFSYPTHQISFNTTHALEYLNYRGYYKVC